MTILVDTDRAQGSHRASKRQMTGRLTEGGKIYEACIRVNSSADRELLGFRVFRSAVHAGWIPSAFGATQAVVCIEEHIDGRSWGNLPRD